MQQCCNLFRVTTKKWNKRHGGSKALSKDASLPKSTNVIGREGRSIAAPVAHAQETTRIAVWTGLLPISGRKLPRSPQIGRAAPFFRLTVARPATRVQLLGSRASPRGWSPIQSPLSNRLIPSIIFLMPTILVNAITTSQISTHIMSNVPVI